MGVVLRCGGGAGVVEGGGALDEEGRGRRGGDASLSGSGGGGTGAGWKRLFTAGLRRRGGEASREEMRC